MSDFVTDYSESIYIPNAWYWLGEVHLAMQQLPQAQHAFYKVVSGFPNNGKIADATYQLGVVYNKLGASKEAKKYLQKVINQYPDSTSATSARAYLQKIK